MSATAETDRGPIHAPGWCWAKWAGNGKSIRSGGNSISRPVTRGTPQRLHRRGRSTRCGAQLPPRICLTLNATEPSFRLKAMELLRRGPFQRYIIGSAISDTGTWMQVMAQGWVMSTLTDRAIVLGMVNLAAGLPTLRLDHDRRLGRGSLRQTQDPDRDPGRADHSRADARSPGVFRLHPDLARHVARRAASASASRSRCRPCPRSCRNWCREEQIATAVALDRSVFHGSRLLGPSLAGLFVGLVGRGVGFLCQRVHFFRADHRAGSCSDAPIGTAEEEEQRRSGFKEGLRYVRQGPHHSCA